LYVKASSSAGDEEQVLESLDPVFPLDWSPDGRFLLYQSQSGESLQDLWVLPFDGRGTPWAFMKTPAQERNASFSPDGRWVSYMSDESGSYEVYVRPFAPPGEAKAGGADRIPSDRTAEQYQISTGGGTYARWRADGKELYYLGPDGRMMAVPVAATGTSFVAGAPVALFPTRILEFAGAGESPRQFDVGPDGRFLINTVLDDKGAPITLILNWQRPGAR
jgi:Tol biopolymer transport system component